MMEMISIGDDTKSDPGRSVLMDMLATLPSDTEEKSTKL